MLNLKYQCALSDWHTHSPMLISNFNGTIIEDARSMKLLGTDYQVEGGAEQLLACIRKSYSQYGPEPGNGGLRAVCHPLGATERRHTHAVQHAEESAYRKFNRVLRDAMEVVKINTAMMMAYRA